MEPHRRRITFASLALSGLLVAGCAALGPVAGDAHAVERNTLIVQNRGWEDVTVYVVRGTAAIRIGVVQGLSSRTFAVPSSVVGTGVLQLRGQRRISDQVFTTPAFDILPGDVARWTIETVPSLSHVFIR